MALGNDQGVREDTVEQLVDRLVRVFVVGALIIAFVAWLERSPLPALVVGAAVVVVVRTWHSVPWAIDGHREPGGRTAHRAALLDGVDLMTSREFQNLIARLLRRDAFTDVRAMGIRDDLSMEIVGRTNAGHWVVVQCNRDDAHRRVGAHDVERFLAAVPDEVEVAVFVTTGRFTRSALALGERHNVVLLDRSQIAAWMTGRSTRLTAYRPRIA